MQTRTEGPKAGFAREINIPLKGGAYLEANLFLPSEAVTGWVVFAHGSGSGRNSPRNQWVAEEFHECQLGTLLVDLLTSQESIQDNRTGEYRFDIPFLSQRLTEVLDWATEVPQLNKIPIGIFGASTGAAAAMIAAAYHPDQVRAVVSRGGRVDLVPENILKEIQAPVLLIVGENDPQVLVANQNTFDKLRSGAQLSVIPKAGHLFEEPGAMPVVAEKAAKWFNTHLRNS